ETGLTQMNGMWRSLIAVDIDNDGDLDFVAGNLGTNNDYHVSETEPLELFAADIDNNGFLDPVQFYYLKDENGSRRSYPAISRSQFSEQVPLIKKQFLFYKDYAQASFRDIFNSKVQDRLQKFYCNETRSCYFENMGGGKFVKHILPMQVQFAPVNSILCDDFDNDGIKDILLAGNEYQAEVMMGRYDASYGCFLKGTGKKSFQYISPVESGFMIRGDVKDLAVILMANGEKRILAAVNNDDMRMFRINQ
ncbi:MAG: RNA-binding protein, partial [Lacibacter sp.]